MQCLAYRRYMPSVHGHPRCESPRATSVSWEAAANKSTILPPRLDPNACGRVGLAHITPRLLHLRLLGKCRTGPYRAPLRLCAPRLGEIAAAETLLCRASRFGWTLWPDFHLPARMRCRIQASTRARIVVSQPAHSFIPSMRDLRAAARLSCQ